jgi:ligand-binding SRPBCC domain-containing protein
VAENHSLRANAAALRRRELVTMFQSSAATVIHRPIGEVFRFATDLANIPLWVSGAQVRLLSTAPFGDGTQFEETLMRFGRAFTSVVEVKNYRANNGFEFQTITAPFPIVSAIGGLHFAATADGTQVTLSHRVHVVPWLRPLEPLLQRVNQTQSQHAVQAMKTSCEG